MRFVVVLFALFLSVFMINPCLSLAQESGPFAPIPLEVKLVPSLKVKLPEKDSIVSSRITLEMEVSNFNLTAKPIENLNSGVIAIYVDGKFFTNVASTSAQLTIAKAGTHRIEVELTRVDRSPLVARVSDSLYVHVQRKSPYLELRDLRPDSTIYIQNPSFKIDYPQSSFEDKTRYYQVFVDGEVDGNSKDLEDSSLYTLKTPLSEGKHSIRLALYNENDRPYVPAVEYQIPVTYSPQKPYISDVKVEENVAFGKDVPLEVELSGFNPGVDGYVDVLAEGVHYYWSSTKGVLVGIPPGEKKITFSLLDRNGFALIPKVEFEKILTVAEAQKSSSPKSFFPSGSFFINETSVHPKWGYLVLGAIEAFAIIVFGTLLLKQERHK